MHNVVPRRMLDISIAVCKRIGIIVTQNFKVNCVTHALISVVVQCNSNNNSNNNNDSPINLLFHFL